jgi:hypothetical protein
MQKDLNAKLTAVEASLKRWHTRLTRAANMLQKLEKQRRRLMPVRTMADRTAEQKADGKMPPFATVTPEPFGAVTNQEQDKLDLPTFLDRRKVKVDKKAMPLTGKAALDYIKPKRKAKA